MDALYQRWVNDRPRYASVYPRCRRHMPVIQFMRTRGSGRWWFEETYMFECMACDSEKFEATRSGVPTVA